MTRFKVFQLRLLASMALLLLVFGVVRWLWYPGAYFAIFGVYKQLLVLTVVVIIVGPVLSAFVYKPGKRELDFDFSVLAGVELLAVVAAMVVVAATVTIVPSSTIAATCLGAIPYRSASMKFSTAGGKAANTINCAI